MYETIRDSAFGHVVHAITGGKLFGWDDETPSNTVVAPSPLSSSSSAATLPVTADADANATAQPPTTAQPATTTTTTTTTTPTPPPTTTTPARASTTEKGTDPNLVTWSTTGLDPANPRNWSTPKKFFVTFEICLLTTSVYIGSAIYTAGVQGVMADFHVSQVVAILGLTLFVAGYGLGPMVWAPMSEIPYFGRTPIYIGTLAVFVFLQFAVIYAKNIGMLLAFRFLTGLFGSPVLATGGATIADMYTPSKQVYGIAVWGIAAVFGPALGPLVGGFAAESEGWKWTIWELLWVSGFCLIFLIFFLPETSSSNILYRRAQRMRKATGNANLKCQPEIEAENMSQREIVMMVLVRPFTLSFGEPIVFALNLYIALIYGLLYLWFESFPLVFVGIYGFTLGKSGLSFVGLLIGAIVVMPPFFWWTRKYLEPRFNADGELHPELRLIPAMVGCFFIPVCLFWFGWSARPSIHWIMPIIGTSFFSIGTFLLFMAVLSYLGDAYPAYVASVYAGNDLMRSSFGASFPLFATAMYHKLGIAWASSLLGFLSIAFIPIPFLLYRYGEALRKRSKMARHDL